MGRKHKHSSKRANNDESAATAGQHGPDPCVACLALHPQGDFVAVAIHDTVRISKCKAAKLQGSTELQRQSTLIRAIAFDNTGKLFLSAGDDKLVKIWKTGSWELLQTARCPKKITAAVFSTDSKLIICADKFGDVFTAAINSDSTASAQPEQSVPAQFLLGHLSSIVTSLTLSPDAKHIVSTDQDCKVRVSIMPRQPEKGAPSIQSICMGHKHFAKCAVFLPATAATAGKGSKLLISGGGDGTVRSWDYMTGKQLDCCTLAEAISQAAEVGLAEDGAMSSAAALAQSNAAKQALGNDSDAEMGALDGADEDAAAEGAAAEAGGEGEEDDDLVAEAEQRARGRQGGQPAVLSLSASPDGCTIAAAIEGQDGISLVTCSSSGQLVKGQKLQLPGLFLPTQVQFDQEGQLWAVGGPLSGSQSKVCISVAQQSGQDGQLVHSSEALTDAVKELLEGHSQQSSTPQSPADAPQQTLAASPAEVMAAYSDLVDTQVNEQLRKRIYSFEERDARKRNRNDVKQ